MATGAIILDLDYLDETSISNAASTYGDESLDVLVNCAGQLYPSMRQKACCLIGAKGVDVHPRAWEENSANDMMMKFRIMTVVSSSGERLLHQVKFHLGAVPCNKAFSV